MKSKINIT